MVWDSFGVADGGLCGMFTTRKRGIQAWEKTTRFDFERERLVDTEPDDRH